MSLPPTAHEIEERTALLDVERGPEYGSQTSLPKGEYIEFFSSFQLLRRNRQATPSIEIQETSQVLYTITCVDTKL
jgi:hypothetical protein